ncbi:hypothetical protein RCH13_001519 [Chryseobacterium sp. MP_3.2]|nr:hypothetical protein [Chryseobacterium sp. MP_3.2]
MFKDLLQMKNIILNCCVNMNMEFKLTFYFTKGIYLILKVGI